MPGRGMGRGMPFAGMYDAMNGGLDDEYFREQQNAIDELTSTYFILEQDNCKDLLKNIGIKGLHDMIVKSINKRDIDKFS